MTGLRSMLARGHRWLLSTHDEPPAVARFRLHLSGRFSATAGTFYLLIAGVRFASGRPGIASLNLLQACLFLGTMRLLREPARVRAVVLVHTTLAYLAAIFIALTAVGGGLSLAMLGLAVIPLFVTLLQGRRFGLVWMVLSLAASGGIGALTFAGVAPWHPPQNTLLAEQVTVTTLTVLLYATAGVYERQRLLALEQIASLERHKLEARYERDVAHARATVAEAERLAALGQVAAMAAHELNNPLAYVKGNLEVLCRALELGDAPLEHRAAARDALEGAERMRRIVADLRDHARGPADDDLEARCDAALALRLALKTAEGHTRPRARVVVELAPAPAVRIAQHHLVQVLLNFVVNAAQAIVEGRASEHTITARVYPRGEGRVCVEVEDDGAGIPEELLERVREPFFTTKRRGEGSGLGLALSEQLLARYGGALELESGAVGALARAVLVAAPAAPEGGSAPTLEASAGGVAALGELGLARVLVVDDDPLVGRSLARQLGRDRVTLAASGREALEALARGPAFDLVLCDVMMPECTGIDVHDELVARGSPVAATMFFLTGGTFTERARAFREANPERFFDKPLDLVKLVAALRARATGG